MNRYRRTAMVVRVALAAGAAMVGAQAPRDQSSLLPPTGTGTIAGIVREPSGQVLGRAKVSISGDMRLDRAVLADDAGRFVFSELPAGRYTVSVEKPGFPRMSYGASLPFRTGAGVFLQDGGAVTNLSLTLGRGAVLTGTVYDQNGEPMPGIGVMAWEIRTSLAGERTLDMPATGGEWVNTDERGVYRIYGLPPGQYTLGTYWAFHGQGSDVRTLTPGELAAAFASAPPGPPPSTLPADATRYNFSPVFTPGVIDPMSAATYTLGPGDERSGVDLRMQFVPKGSVEVSVRHADGAPAPSGTRVTLSRRGPVAALNTGLVSGTTEGVFRSASLSPSPYRFLAEVRATPTSPAFWAREDFILAAGQPLALTVTLQPALTLTATARFDGAGVTPPKDLSRLAFGLRPLDGLSVELATAVTPAGQATITGVIPARYMLAPSVPAGIAGGVTWTAAAVTINGQDVMDKAFDVPPGGIGAIDVTFTNVASEIGGVLTSASGAAATDYFVIVIPADRAYWLPFSRRIVSTRPDGQGRYVFRNLPPGEYRLALTSDLIPRDLQDTAALERLAVSSVPLTLRAGEKQTLDLKAAR